MDQEWCGQQDQGSDSSSVFGTGWAAPQMLCPVPGPPIYEGHGGAGACPEKGNKADEGSEHKSSEKRLRELRMFILEEAQKRSHHSLQLSDRRVQPGGGWALFPDNPENSDKTRGQKLSSTRGCLGWTNILHRKGDWALEWATQGGG